MVRRLPVKEQTQVRFLSPQLYGRASRTTALRGGARDGNGFENRRAFSKCLEGSSPSPSASTTHVPLAERQRRQPSKLDRRVRLPQGTLGDRLRVGCLPLNQATEVRILLPEPFHDRESLFDNNTAGWLLLVATPGSEPGGRWFDSNPRNSMEVIRPDEEPVLKTGGG